MTGLQGFNIASLIRSTEALHYLTHVIDVKLNMKVSQPSDQAFQGRIFPQGRLFEHGNMGLPVPRGGKGFPWETIVPPARGRQCSHQYLHILS